MSRNVKDPLRKLNLRRQAAPLSANDPVTASEAKQTSRASEATGLPRRFAPRNDEAIRLSR